MEENGTIHLNDGTTIGECEMKHPDSQPCYLLTPGYSAENAPGGEGYNDLPALAAHTAMDIAAFVVEERNLPLGWPKQSDICHLAQHSIRLIDLMSMTAGLSYDMQSEPLMQLKEQSKNQAGTRAVVAAMVKMPLLYEPGTRWAYSLAHDVLAAVVEVVSGIPFGEYLRKNIFEPLGVKELFFHLDEEKAKRVSALYEFHSETGKIVPADMKRHTTYKITENYERKRKERIGRIPLVKNAQNGNFTCSFFFSSFFAYTLAFPTCYV